MPSSPTSARERVLARRERGFALIGQTTKFMAAGAVALTGTVAVAAASSQKTRHSTPATTLHATRHHSSEATSSDDSTASSQPSPLQAPQSTPSPSSSPSSSSAVSGGS